MCAPSIRLKFKFRRGSLPPMMPLEFVGCVGGCDEMLREVLDLKYLRAVGSGGSGGGGLDGGGRGRGDGPRPARASGSNSRPSRPPVPTWTPQPPPPPPGSADGNVIVCNCGQQALLLTVRKDGPNQGRQFYKCNGGTCGFFLWADQPGQPGRGPPLQALGLPRGPPGFTRDPGSSGPTTCNCNEAAVTRTVQKDGPNKGRTFYTCGRAREQQCGFFQWADENAPPPLRSVSTPTLPSFTCRLSFRGNDVTEPQTNPIAQNSRFCRRNFPIFRLALL